MSENTEYIPYHDILIENGWRRDESGGISSPNDCFSLTGNGNVPVFMIEEMLKAIRSQLREALREPNREEFQKQIDDLEACIKITENLVAEHSTEGD